MKRMIVMVALALVSFKAAATCEMNRDLSDVGVAPNGQPVDIAFEITERGRGNKSDQLRMVGSIKTVLTSSTNPRRSVNQYVCREVSYVAARSTKDNETRLFPGTVNEGTTIFLSQLDSNHVLVTTKFMNVDDIKDARSDTDPSVVSTSTTQVAVVASYGKQTHQFKADGKRYVLTLDMKDVPRDETD